MKSLKIALAMFIGVALLSSCKDKKKDPDPVDESCTFDVVAMNTNIGNNIIIKYYEQYKNACASLQTAATQFRNTPDSSNLVALQNELETAYLHYQYVSMFNFGPAVDNGYDHFLKTNTFPSDTVTIVNHITVSNLDPASNGNATVGFPALDFLLHAGGHQSTMYRLTAATNASNARTYVEALATQLSSHAAFIHNEWIASGGNYIATFTGSGGNATGTPLSLLCNQFNYDFETLKNFKMKIPLGKFNAGIPLPDKVEGFYAGNSMKLMVAQYNAFIKLYHGTGYNGNPGLGFHDYLECLDSYYAMDDVDLSVAIEQQMRDLETKLAVLPDPLSNTLSVNKPAVDEAHTEMQYLVPLIKREMTAAFGVQITYVDNDGD